MNPNRESLASHSLEQAIPIAAEIQQSAQNHAQKNHSQAPFHSREYSKEDHAKPIH